MSELKAGVLKRVVPLATFAAGVEVSLLVWDKIKLPCSNPWGVTGELTLQRYNPNSNLLRFGMLLLLPSLLLIGLYLLKLDSLDSLCFQRSPRAPEPAFPERHGRKSKALLLALLALAVVLVAASLSTPFYVGRFDPFHDGESLGPAVSYLKGQVPYRDFVMVHGPIQDPLRTVWAFKLFGTSIGASRAFESMIKVLTFLFLALFVMRLHRGKLLPSLLTLAALFAIAEPFTGGTALYIAAMLVLSCLLLFFLFMAVFRRVHRHFLPAALVLLLLLSQRYYFLNVMPRDVTTFAWLLTVPAIQSMAGKDEVGPFRLSLAVFFFSFLPVASLAYSTDRGIYLLLIFLLLFPAIYLLYFRAGKHRVRLLLVSALGLCAGILFLGVVIKGAFLDFFKFAVLTFPRYVNLLNGTVLGKSTIAVLALPAFGTFWFTLTAIRELRPNGNGFKARLDSFLREHLAELALWLVSVLYFINVLHRSDDNHLFYTATFSYIFVLYILIKYYLGSYIREIAGSPRAGKALRYFTVTATVALFALTVCMVSLNHQRVVELGFPLNVKDEELIPQDYKDAIAFLKQNMEDGDGFLSLDSEGGWYYFLDIPCPVRFSSIWLASPEFYQQEVVEDLEATRVKFVLYPDNSLADRPGITVKDRVPIIVDYIEANFTPCRSFGSKNIWIRKDLLPQQEPFP